MPTHKPWRSTVRAERPISTLKAVLCLAALTVVSLVLLVSSGAGRVDALFVAVIGNPIRRHAGVVRLAVFACLCRDSTSVEAAS